MAQLGETSGKESEELYAGVGTGVAGGAVTGAVAGSVVPVIGTAVGAVVGGVVGGVVGFFGAKQKVIQERQQRALAKRQEEAQKNADAKAKSAQRRQQAVGREMASRASKEGRKQPAPTMGADEVLMGATVHGPGSPYDSVSSGTYGRSTVKSG